MARKKIKAYDRYVLQPILQKRIKQNGEIQIKFYSEKQLMELPLRVRPSESKIKAAEEAICKNSVFLARIPPRLNPEIPAYIAAEFSFGRCVVLPQ